MYRSEEGLILVDALQFDPMTQIVIGVRRWPDEAGYQPRDMSWGYVDTGMGRQHVRVGDWIGRDKDGSLYVCTNATFIMHFTRYEEAPSMTRTADMTLHIDTTAEAKEWIAQLQAVAEKLSEERIRAIVKEEIEACEKRRITDTRTGYPPTYWPDHEVKQG